MSFDPLGGWNPNAPLDPDALAKAQAFAASQPSYPAGDITRPYLHWEVEAFGCIDAAYDFVVDLENEEWVIRASTSPANNIAGYNNDPEIAGTFHRNTGSVAIAIAGMDGATETNFGPDGVQRHEIEVLCALAALCCRKYGIDSVGTVPAPGTNHLDNNNNNVNTTGEQNILTHAEVAVIDAYPTERWDLGTLVPLPEGVTLTPEMRTQTGNALRTRIHLYAEALAA